MPYTLQVPDVPDEIVSRLDERLREMGQDRSTYLLSLLQRDLQPHTLDQILAPFHAQVAASRLSDEELETLFEEARLAKIRENHL